MGLVHLVRVLVTSSPCPSRATHCRRTRRSVPEGFSQRNYDDAAQKSTRHTAGPGVHRKPRLPQPQLGQHAGMAAASGPWPSQRGAWIPELWRARFAHAVYSLYTLSHTRFSRTHYRRAQHTRFTAFTHFHTRAFHARITGALCIHVCTCALYSCLTRAHLTAALHALCPLEQNTDMHIRATSWPGWPRILGYCVLLYF